MACTCLLKRFAPRLYRLALQISGNPDDAEDIIQESFIQACNHLDNFEGRSGLSTWLHRIVLNAALMQLRKRGPISGALPEWDESRTLQVSAQRVGAMGQGDTSTDRVLSQVLSQELRETIDRAILLLPDALRAAIVLRDVEGLSTAETAQALGITESAVKVRLHRARLALRRSLTPYLEGYEGPARGAEG
jgi:RNA polymerase sigma-70 factor (ECF subfamily)